MDTDHRAAAAAMWDGGDYDRLATALLPAAQTLAQAAGDAVPGPALDLGAGTGSLAALLARDGRPTDAVDLAPGLVAKGRARTEAEGLDVRWQVASFEGWQDPPETYAVIASSFGLIFASDPVEVLRDVGRALRTDGTALLATWDSDGYIASMTRAMTEFLPEPGRSAARAWIRWGDAAQVHEWFTEAGWQAPTIEPTSLPWRFPSAHDAVKFLFSASPGHVAAAHAMGPRRHVLTQVVTDHLVSFAGIDSADDPVDVAASYLVVSAGRR